MSKRMLEKRIESYKIMIFFNVLFQSLILFFKDHKKMENLLNQFFYERKKNYA